MLTFFIDELTPCLIDTKTGEIIETEVVRIVRKSFLSKYNKKNGWYTNWANELALNEVYALVLKGSMDIQGLISLRFDKESKQTYVSWGCVHPESNKVLAGDEVKYRGIGGHLMAIASDKSIEWNLDGSFYGFAANKKLFEHYQEKYNAEPIRALHPYHVIFPSWRMKEIREEYTYEWTDEEI